jgi:hypothetical protein
LHFHAIAKKGEPGRTGPRALGLAIRVIDSQPPFSKSIKHKFLLTIMVIMSIMINMEETVFRKTLLS